jgi:hypothetical protein
MNNDKIVDLYRCICCNGLVICKKGNYHPWCLRCMCDEFDWSNGIENITLEEAEHIIKNENQL